VLSYNVAGLPEGLSSGNPRVNTPIIGQRIRPYDVVHVQEDFNYHASLYANDTHPFRTPTSGGVPFGDGLNTLSDHQYSDLARDRWDRCNGTDCLTPKGFTLARVRLAGGVFLDLYNVHTNADVTDAALAARRANIEQLSDFIQTTSAGNAVIVMGDTNTRYTREGDNIRTLTEENGLTDAWVELVRGGEPPAQGDEALVCDAQAPTDACEVVDKILYRDGPLLDLAATRYHNDWEAFLREDGEHLSDHFPHTVGFSWTLADGLRAGDYFGGPHGTAFNDADDLPAAAARGLADPEVVDPLLDGWSAFARRHLLDATDAPRRGSQCWHGGPRLYDTPWLAQFFHDRHLAQGREADLDRAARIIERSFALGGATHLSIST
jgi:endonuclease/exonuclease/phosphatase family metal-dependent hydrolase